MTHPQNRREFLRTTAAAAGAYGLGLVGGQGCAPDGDTPAPMTILILGGTGFIGPHMVRRAVSRGHEVTLFNRGRTNPHLFPELEKLVGDRDGDLEALEGRSWDAVIDNSGFVPRHVRDSAELLSESGRYLFVSSISAYKDLAPAGITEDYEVGRLDDPAVEQVTGATYGPLKALCEEAVREVFGERANIVRPGFIVGPGDPSDRWTYWPVRVSMGGDMAVPGAPGNPVQFIDARDLAIWVVGMLESGVGGVFNGVGPVEPLDMGTFLETCRDVSGGDAVFHWVEAGFIREQNIFFPIWSPTTGDFGGAHQVDISRAMATGYRSRPLADTVRDTLEWWNGLTDEDRPGGALRAGPRKPGAMGGQPISTEEMLRLEAELLEAWATRA
ncbi:MAG: NAD-dependent epimerase/dehydratase family protein [Gemmatimonadota bacterium]|nr:NAD-dependent epimerase/dehydratase family protein [Gemmatimonadota bacterium]MDE2871626.1 NAD-dependent epimerase/dehydratase family protein [Gemmatimonadota bacterium]